LDLTRKGSQVQTLSRPPQFSLVRALSVLGGQRSSCAAAALRPHFSPPTRRDPAPLGSAAPPPPRRPRSVVTTFWFGPVVGPPPGNLPRTHLREDLSVLAFCRASKPTGTAPSRWTSSAGRPGGECGAAASGGRSGGQACRGRLWSRVRPSPLGAWPELGRRPIARMQTPRTPDTCPSGRPDRTGRVGHRTRGQQTAARPLDGRPHGGHRTRTARRLAWSVSGHPGRPRPRPRPRRRRRRPSVGLAGLLGLQRLRRSATHGGDALTAPASAALTATATGQLRNTARYEAARDIVGICG
jgi:hypothetical protein